MPSSPNDLPVGRVLLDEALLAHAQLSRATWAVMAAYEQQYFPTVALVTAVRALSDLQRQTTTRCACSPPESGGDWCTGHCQHATQENK